MSSCLSGGGGGRAYKSEPSDLDIIKSSSPTSWISNSPSPSSTLSESSNCPLPISTRKRRTPRKRPNQAYNEAAAILSTAYPKIFPTKHVTKPRNFTKSLNKNTPLSFDPTDLLLPFQAIDTSGFLLHPQRSNFSVEPKGPSPFEKTCRSPEEYEKDFDAESIILDEEIGEGIDCIMGNLGLENESIEGFSSSNTNNNTQMNSNNFVSEYPVGLLGFEFGQYGMRREIRATRNVDQDDWWRFPSVNVFDLNPKVAKNVMADNKKTTTKKKKKVVEINNLEPKKEEFGTQQNGGLLLKLNYDGVLDAWSDKASPFSGECPGAEVAGNDVQARLAQIDLFSDNGGTRKASVLRYKEKRRSRLFYKKIRYQVRKVNADRRPRMKGRFIRTPNSSDD